MVQVFRLAERVGEVTEPAELAVVRNRCIQKVSEDTPQLKYNTAIAELMKYAKRLRDHEGPIPRVSLETLALLLSPYCPHAAEELWERLGGTYSVHQKPWPTADPELLREDEVVVVVSVDGKKRDQVTVPRGTSGEELERLALSSARVTNFLNGRRVDRVVVVPDKQVNLVLAR